MGETTFNLFKQQKKAREKMTKKIYVSVPLPVFRFLYHALPKEIVAIKIYKTDTLGVSRSQEWTPRFLEGHQIQNCVIGSIPGVP